MSVSSADSPLKVGNLVPKMAVRLSCGLMLFSTIGLAWLSGGMGKGSAGGFAWLAGGMGKGSARRGRRWGVLVVPPVILLKWTLDSVGHAYMLNPTDLPLDCSLKTCVRLTRL